jgi:hypothetical protein
MPTQLQTVVHPGHDKFFRSRLLVLDSDQIGKMLEQMDTEVNDIRQEALKMSWYMRGGLTYDQAMSLGANERKIINGLIKENLETTKKSGLPFF